MVSSTFFFVFCFVLLYFFIYLFSSSIDLIIDYLTVTIISLAIASSMMITCDLFLYYIYFISSLFISFFIIYFLTLTTISLAIVSSMMMLFDILFYLINFISQLYIYLLSLTTRLSSDDVSASGMVILYHFVILFYFVLLFFISNVLLIYFPTATWFNIQYAFVLFLVSYFLLFI